MVVSHGIVNIVAFYRMPTNFRLHNARYDGMHAIANANANLIEQILECWSVGVCVYILGKTE